MHLSSAVERARRLYDDQGRGVRLFVLARHLLAPLERIAADAPHAGRILDLGCGHGLFSHLLALQSPSRSVLGVDPSEAKIRVARRAGRSVPNVRFVRGTVHDVADDRFDAITILDVLYLLPPSDKRALLARCRELLKPGGVLLVKTNDIAPAWKYFVTRAQEAVMTGLGLTYGQGLYFWSQSQHLALLREQGFASRVERLSGWWPYPHVLFVAHPDGHTAVA